MYVDCRATSALHVIVSVLVTLCPLIKFFVPNIQDGGLSKVARLWNDLLLLRGCPAVGVIRRKLPRTQTKIGKSTDGH